MSKGDDFLCASEGKNPPVNHVRRFKSRVLGKQRSAGFTSERLGTDIATYAPDKTSMAATVSKQFVIESFLCNFKVNKQLNKYYEKNFTFNSTIIFYSCKRTIKK